MDARREELPGGRHLDVRVAGDGAPEVLVVHDATTAARWRALLERWPPGAGTVHAALLAAPPAPGPSDAPAEREDARVAERAADLVALLERLRLRDVLVVGDEPVAPVARRLAQAGLLAVRALVLVTTAGAEPGAGSRAPLADDRPAGLVPTTILACGDDGALRDALLAEVAAARRAREASRQAEELFDAALLVRDQGDAAGAIALLERALREPDVARPIAVHAHLQLGHLRGSAAGLHEYRRAVELGPRVELASFALFVALLKADRWPEALDELLRLLALRPSGYYDAWLADMDVSTVAPELRPRLQRGRELAEAHRPALDATNRERVALVRAALAAAGELTGFARDLARDLEAGRLEGVQQRAARTAGELHAEHRERLGAQRVLYEGIDDAMAAVAALPADAVVVSVHVDLADASYLALVHDGRCLAVARARLGDDRGDD